MRLSILDSELCIGCQCCMFACSRKQNEAGLANSCIDVKSLGGMEHGFTVIVCRACYDPPCVKVCPTSALAARKGGGVRLDHSKCIGCRNCQDACLINAVYWDDETNKPNICIHCGYCVDYCPHGGIETRGAQEFI
ncbi:MAG TPA: 4Fe-4S binding protein [Dehalococcoidia bacterium]|nr:4Fe-4S binding protein [Dehalococcoidia bacterium]